MGRPPKRVNNGLKKYCEDCSTGYFCVNRGNVPFLRDPEPDAGAALTVEWSLVGRVTQKLLMYDDEDEVKRAAGRV